MGKETPDLQQDGSIPQILSKGSLKLKVMVSSGESNLEKLEKIGSKILGVGWNPINDNLNFNFERIISKQNRKEHNNCEQR